MATLDVGASTARRELNRELPLVPFIDFLLCIVAFLLVTAVWSQMARVDASSAAPGAPSTDPDAVRPMLHVSTRGDDRFVLEWRQGSTVLSHEDVAREPEPRPDGLLRYPALADAVRRNWAERGLHRNTTDGSRDRAVLHTGNTIPFEQIVGAMDAIHAPERVLASGATAAFDVVFATD